MSLRAEIDPELAVLRSVARAVRSAPNGRNDLEAARFSLFQAAERGDRALARRWLEVCRVEVDAAEVSDVVRASATRAISRIATVLGE